MPGRVPVPPGRALLVRRLPRITRVVSARRVAGLLPPRPGLPAARIPPVLFLPVLRLALLRLAVLRIVLRLPRLRLPVLRLAVLRLAILGLSVPVLPLRPVPRVLRVTVLPVPGVRPLPLLLPRLL